MDQQFKKESKHLEKTVNIVRDSREDLEESLEKLSKFNIKKLKEMRENPITNAADYAQFLNMLKNKNVAFNVMAKYQKLEELGYLEDQPYFSRIDLKDRGTGVVNKRYIGKFGFVDEYDRPIILDWRAKAASVFYNYRYPQDNVTYESPEGPITKDLLLKRTYEIDEGELIKYYNNDIKLDEDDLIAEKIEGRTGGVLEDIIETIQQNQHEIINADPRRVTIVQGTVGSGKSTVAIHKLSYIFFNYPEIINPERSILIAKNQILVGYLSTLFPKLGIFDINYGTIRDVIYNLIFKEEINIDFDLGENQNLDDFGKNELNKLLERLDNIHKDYEKEVKQIFNKEENEPFAGFVYDNTRSVEQNLIDAIKDLKQEIRFQKDFVKESPNHTRSELFKQNIKIMKKIVRSLMSIKRKIKSKTLKQLIDKYSLLEDGFYGYKEALIFVIIYSELFGFDEYEKFEYCVVDEGQDFNILEYYVLDKLVQNGRFCILGDLNQSYNNSGIKQWEEILDVVSGAKDAQKFVLKTNYRSTKPIVEFANSILKPYTKNYLPKPINRRGNEPEIVGHDTFNDVVDRFEKQIKKDTKKLEKSIGVICMNKKYKAISEKIISKLKIPEDKFIKLDSGKPVSYLPRAAYLTDFENAKGLEFGKVYVLGLNPDKISSFNQAKKAFVAVTRAMDELSIYYEK